MRFGESRTVQLPVPSTNCAGGPPHAQAACTAVLLCVSGALLAFGVRTRAAAAIGCAALGHALLLDASLYQNHFWLLLQLLLCFAVVPPSPLLRSLLRFATSLPYAFGALAKVASADWLL